MNLIFSSYSRDGVWSQYSNRVCSTTCTFRGSDEGHVGQLPQNEQKEWLGMQLMVIEYLRNKCGRKTAQLCRW